MAQELSELREKVREMEEFRIANLPTETSPLKENEYLNPAKRSINVIYLLYSRNY